MFRRFVLFSMALTLTVSTIACGTPSVDRSASNSSPAQSPGQVTGQSPAQSPSRAASNLTDGDYGVQQATYDDINGEYTVMLLNTPPGQPAVFRSTNLPMARLTEEEVSSGKKSYLKVENGQPALHLTEDFRIEYVHNVTETQTNAQTGQQEVVVVRQEPSFWTPFAGALAGQALGSLLFRPQYYFPPAYQPGGGLVGYGGYGRTYGEAANRYQTRYSSPPAAVRNQTLRTTGQLRSPTVRRPATPQRTQTNRPSGSGYGSSNLRRSNSPTRPRVDSNRGFGSSTRRSRSRRR